MEGIIRMQKNNGRTRKAALNISYNIFNQILMLILSFISRTVFIWGFGVEYLGINGLFSDILSLLSMADLGFNTAMTYSYYRPLAEKNYKKISELTTFYKNVYNTIAFFIALIGILLIPFLPILVNLKKDIPNLNIYYLLSLSSVVVSYLCVYKTTVLLADQKGYILTKINILTNILKTILQIFSIVLWKNYILYLIIGTVIAIGNNIYASYVATKNYSYIQNKYCNISLEEKRNIFNNLKSVFLYKVSSVLLNATDNIIISALIGTAMVGYYSNYLLLQTKITTIISIIFTSMTASIGNLIVTEGKKKRYEIFRCEQSLSFIICGIVVPCYVLLANDFIDVWLGELYQLDICVVYAIGINMYLSCVLQPLWSYREATGLYRKTKWVMMICAIINIVLSICLGRLFGVFGVIIASAISRIITYVWYEPHLLFKEYFGTSEFKYYYQIILNVILITILILIGNQIGSLFNVISLKTWFTKAVTIGIISVGGVIVTYYRSEGIKLLRNRIRK